MSLKSGPFLAQTREKRVVDESGLVVPYRLNGTPYNSGFQPFGPIDDTIDGLEFVRKIRHHGDDD
ncbi:MAG TPA: hypothetical protein VKO41_03095 [Gaiellaceae bacterium]|nr:hypothetical protein [Gaiellaceae bacterium]